MTVKGIPTKEVHGLNVVCVLQWILPGKEQIILILSKPFQSTESNGKLCDSFYNSDDKDNTTEETDSVPYRSTEESITHSTSKSNLDVFWKNNASWLIKIYHTM